MVSASYGRSSFAIGQVDSVSEIGAEATGALSFDRGSYAIVRGWALRTDALKPISDLHVRIGDEAAVRALTGLPRPDVSAIYGAAANDCGFAVALPITAATGEHLLVFETSIDGQMSAVGIEHPIIVVSARDPFDATHERSAGWAYAIDGVHGEGRGFVPASEDGTVTIPWPERAHIRLWVIDVAGGGAPVRVIARAGGATLAVVRDIVRTDASTDVGLPEADRCGFAVAVSAPLYGVQVIDLFAVGADGGRAFLGSVRVRAVAPLPFAALPRTAHICGRLDAVSIDGAARDGTDVLALGPHGVLHLRGWAVDEIGPARCAAVYAETDSGLHVEGRYGDERPDVAADLQANGIAACGFAITLGAAGLASGRHVLTISAMNAHGDAIGILGAPLVIDTTDASGE